MTFSRSASTPRLLQQQPPRYSDRQQQQSSGAGEFQPKAGAQMGEGSQEGIRDYGRPDKPRAERLPAGAGRLQGTNVPAGAVDGRVATPRKPPEQAQ